MNKPKNPAEELKKLLELRQIGQIILAKDTGLSAKCINTLCTGKLRISVRVAVLLEKYLPYHSAEHWLRMEMEYQLDKERCKLIARLNTELKEMQSNGK
jgi:plasmid maintenance system antidote protein VapI